MADVLTPNFGLNKPDISGSNDTWGVKLNLDMDIIDSAMATLASNIASVAAAQLATAALLPVGIICMWNGSLGSVPAGWQLCDGTNGTPNLKDKFVVGAGGLYKVNDNGGAASNTPQITVKSHVLTVDELPAHNHGVTDAGHTHVVNDQGHAHDINDPGHAHTYTASNNQNNSTSGAGGTANKGIYQDATSNQRTGISIQVNNTGVTLANAKTGIAINNAGGGNGHVHDATCAAVPTLPPYVAKAFIMRVAQ